MDKKTHAICMAEGGIPPKETADQILARMTATYGAPAAGPATPAPVQTAPPPPKPAAPPSGSGQGIFGILKGRKDAIDKASGFADGGIPDETPKVRLGGVGGDSTRWVSNGAGGPAAGPGMIPEPAPAIAAEPAAVGPQPRAPLGSAQEAAERAAMNRAANPTAGIAQPGPAPTAPAAPAAPMVEPAAAAAPAAEAAPASRAGKAVSAMGTAAKSVGGIKGAAQWMAKGVGKAAVAVAPPLAALESYNESPENIQALGNSIDLDASKRGQNVATHAVDTLDKLGNNLTSGMAGELGHAISDGQNDPKYADYAKVPVFGGVAATAAAAADRLKGWWNAPKAAPVPVPTPETAPQEPVVATANANEADLTGRQAGHMIENNLSSFEDKGSGITRQVGSDGSASFTNVGTESITDPAKKVAAANSYDGKGVNDVMARENKIRGEMIDEMIKANGGNGVAILPDRTNEDNEKLQAMRLSPADYLAYQQAKGRQEAAINESAAQRALTMRGQDLTAQAEANRLAGNPVDNQIKQNQVAAGQMSNATIKQLADLHAAYSAETDPAKRATLAENIRVLSGKDKAANFKAIHAAGGTSIDPSNPMVPLKSPDSVVMYNENTGEVRNVSSGSGNQRPKPSPEQIAVMRQKKNDKAYRAATDQMFGPGTFDAATKGFAEGGIPQRFRFEGEGGPREDKIPVKVAGDDINVSDGEEALILPAKTAGNPHAIDAISQIITASNDGRPPAMGQHGKLSFAAGGLLGGCRRRAA